jgi:transcriptional regulator with XRE-family HTH domain
MRVNGDRVRLEREKRAWSQDHLAAAAGIGVRTIQRIEATGIASYESVRAISAALQIPVVDLRVSDGPSLPTMTDAELRASGLRELAALPRRGGAARLRLTARCFGAAMAVAILAPRAAFCCWRTIGRFVCCARSSIGSRRLRPRRQPRSEQPVVDGTYVR